MGLLLSPPLSMEQSESLLEMLSAALEANGDGSVDGNELVARVLLACRCSCPELCSRLDLAGSMESETLDCCGPGEQI